MIRTIIVEDDPMVTSINQMYLSSYPQFHLVNSFSNGKEALKYLETHPADLAICDYYMPEMDGHEFIQACRDREINIRFIMITAAAAPQDVSDFMRLGVVDYIVKPFIQQRFSQALEKYIRVEQTLRSSRMNKLSQDEIDQMLGLAENSEHSMDAVPKGINMQTLESLRKYLREHKNELLTSHEIASNLQLSRITIRRYMNYLLENNEIVSQMDYSTGGRPSIRYKIQ